MGAIKEISMPIDPEQRPVQGLLILARLLVGRTVKTYPFSQKRDRF